jgi:hypothetical protein
MVEPEPTRPYAVQENHARCREGGELERILRARVIAVPYL